MFLAKINCAIEPLDGESSATCQAEAIDLMNGMYKENTPNDFSKRLEVINKQKNRLNQDTEESVEEVIGRFFKKFPREIENSRAAYAKLKEIHGLLVQKLKSYKPNAITFTHYLSMGLITMGSLNMKFDVIYVNGKGGMKKRAYQATFTRKGLLAEIKYSMAGIYFVGDGFNFYDSNKKIECGQGFDMGMTQGIGCYATYIPFNNLAGAIVMAGLSGGVGISLRGITSYLQPIA